MTKQPTDDDHSLDLLIPKLRALRLPGMARVLPTLLAQAKADNLTDLEILHRDRDFESLARTLIDAARPARRTPA